MKRSIVLFALVAIVAIGISCKKSSSTPTDPAYVGLWKGKYGSGPSSYPTNAYQFLFRSNGSVRVFDGADTSTAGKAEGTYTISGLTVNTTYTYLGGGSTFSTTATMDSRTSFQEGTWGSGTNTTNGGRFFIVKQ